MTEEPSHVPPPMDVPTAETMLLEAKAVFEARRITFFLRQGTCLGAVHDGAFIPWDDDIDIGSVLGMHGLTLDAIEPVAAAFRERGFDVTRLDLNGSVYLGLAKHAMHIDWFCYVPNDGVIVQHPGVRIPVDLLEHLTTLDFLGTQFTVPSPPERYLEIKYGADWRTPKQAGDFERDILAILPIPHTPLPTRVGRIIAARLPVSRRATLHVLDDHGVPVSGAVITLIGRAILTTGADGGATVYLRAPTSLAVMVAFGAVEEILYDERFTPGLTHIYRRDPAHLTGRLGALAKEPTR